MWVASLPMYDRPELRAETDALWAFIRHRLRASGVDDVPEQLSRPADHTLVWRDPQLLFTQTCGYDLRHDFADQHHLLGAPVSTALGCVGATYASFHLVRHDDPARDMADLRGRRAAFNERTSFSGRVTLELAVAPLAVGGAFFSHVVETGAHEASAEAVVEGRADVSCIDCHTFALMQRARPALAGALRIVGRSPQAPAPPYVAGPATSEEIRRALAAALLEAGTAPELADVRRALLLDSVEEVPLHTYARAALLRERPYAYDATRDGEFAPFTRA